MGRFFMLSIGTLVLSACLASPLPAQKKAPMAAEATPIRVKVVVVAMFEVGEDTGDTYGEYQLWVEREDLDQVLPLFRTRLNNDQE